ncbi:MAG: hypothetical protein U7127_03280 [Phormidium sp.]
MLEAYVHQYTQDNVSAFGRKFGLSRYEIIRWYSGVTIPNLDKLLLITDTHDKPRSPALLAIFDFYE